MTPAERQARRRAKRKRQLELERRHQALLDYATPWDKFLETIPEVDPDDLLGRHTPHPQ